MERFGVFVSMHDASGKRIPDAVRRITYRGIAATLPKMEGYATAEQAEKARATLSRTLQSLSYVSPYMNA